MNNPPPTKQALPNKPFPQSLTDLFVFFTLISVQGFGGVMAIVQRELVEKKTVVDARRIY